MDVYNYLRSYDIKPSVQRIAIMQYLLEHKTHPCIDEIYSALCTSIPTLSKTTVYNTLKLFTEHGAAQMLTIDERNACFDGDTSCHAHFLCRKCGRIFDFPLPLMERRATDELNQTGFQTDETQLYYKGLCPDCKKEESQECN